MSFETFLFSYYGKNYEQGLGSRSNALDHMCELMVPSI